MHFPASPAASPDVSIIVPCRNESRYIGMFLESVLGQDTRGLTCEILIAEGRSGDNTANVLAKFVRSYPYIQVIDNPEQIVSTGLNRAITLARGEYVIRLDVHTEYAPDYIWQCVQTLLRTGADNVGGPMRNVGSGRTGRAIAAAFHSPFSCGGARFHNASYEGEVDTVPYGCWRRMTLVRLGMFDPGLVRNQDDELNLRLIRSGGKIWQSPHIRMAYHPRPSIERLASQYFQYGYWKVAVIRKHRIPASWRHLVPGLFVAGLVLGSALTAGLALAGLQMAALPLAVSLTVFTTVYALLVTFASVNVARHAGWDLFLILPVVFATYHLAYGIGFVIGMLRNDYRPAPGQPTAASGGAH